MAMSIISMLMSIYEHIANRLEKIKTLCMVDNRGMLNRCRANLFKFSIGPSSSTSFHVQVALLELTTQPSFCMRDLRDRMSLQGSMAGSSSRADCMRSCRCVRRDVVLEQALSVAASISSFCYLWSYGLSGTGPIFLQADIFHGCLRVHM